MWEPDHEELKRHPAYVAVERGYKNRPNVVGIYKGAGGGRSLLFNGHVDVIPAGPPDAWPISPWAGEIEKGSALRPGGLGHEERPCGHDHGPGYPAPARGEAQG